MHRHLGDLHLLLEETDDLLVTLSNGEIGARYRHINVSTVIAEALYLLLFEFPRSVGLYLAFRPGRSCRDY